MRHKIYVFMMMLLLLAFMCACGSTDTDPNAGTVPTAPESTDASSPDPLSKLVFVFDDGEHVPQNEDELTSALTSLKAFCADGRQVYLQIYGVDNSHPALKSHIEAQGLHYVNTVESDIVRDCGISIMEHSVLTEIEPAFLLTIVSYKGVDRVELVPASASDGADDGEFPDFEVGVYAGDAFVSIHNTRELAECLSALAESCNGGKAYDGIGVHLYGFEVETDHLTGIPYCHLSYGAQGKTATVLGFKHDVITDLDASLIVDLLLICPYFERVVFFPVSNAAQPRLALSY